jgi:hypothetical protein
VKTKVDKKVKAAKKGKDKSKSSVYKEENDTE